MKFQQNLFTTFRIIIYRPDGWTEQHKSDFSSNEINIILKESYLLLLSVLV